MATWKLQKNTGTNQTFADWGLNTVQLDLHSMDEDVLQFVHDGASFIGTPIFAEGDKLTVTFAADDVTYTKVFVGFVREIIPSGGPRTESFSYKVYNAWEWMKTVVFQQKWKFADTPGSAESDLSDKYVSRVILGVNSSGDFVDIGTIVTEIINFAMTEAAIPMAFAGFTDTTLIPAEETRDLTIAGALLRILRWLPDIATWWDYTTTNPTLHIVHRADLTEQVIDLPAPGTDPDDCGDAVTQIKLSPAYKQQVSAVVLRYLLAGQNDYGWNEVTIDKYPAEATGFERKALVQTLELIPGRAEEALLQSVITDVLPSASNVDGTGGMGDTEQSGAVSLLKHHFPRLKKSDISEVKVKKLAYYEEDGTWISGDLGDYNTELIDGAITPWMETSFSIVSKVISFKMEAQYKVTDPDTGGVGTFKHVFEAKTLLATNAITQVYKLVTSPGIFNETPPSGLAEALYNVMNPLQWSGSIQTTEVEIARVLRPGKRLNFTGGNVAWESIDAIVMSVSANIDAGITIASLGPSEHLGPQDMIERLRLGRDRAAVASIAQRVNGFDSSPLNNLELSKKHPHKPAPALTQTTGQIVGYTGSASVVREIALRECTACDPATGTLRKQLQQASEFYD